MSAKTKQKRRTMGAAADVEFHSIMVPTHQRAPTAIVLRGYKAAIYLEVARAGCCPRGTERIEVPLYDTDFDVLIGMLRRAKVAVKKARNQRVPK